jgi:hypothetical protein
VSTGRFGTQHYSLITCDVLAATDCVLVNVVIRFEKLLSYLDRCIELQPLLVGRQADAVDVVSSEPVDDRVDRALGWGKYLVDLLGGVVFAIVGRVVYGADIGSEDHIAFDFTMTYTSINRSCPFSRFDWTSPIRIGKIEPVGTFSVLSHPRGGACLRSWAARDGAMGEARAVVTKTPARREDSILRNQDRGNWKNDTSCSTFTAKEDLRDLIYVSVSLKTHRNTACSMMLPGNKLSTRPTTQSRSGSRRSPSACVLDAEKLR